MSATARDYQLQEDVRNDGLDDLFLGATHCDAIDSQAMKFDSRFMPDATHRELTIIDASLYLKVSPSTVYRRIKAGKYQTTEDTEGTIKVLLPGIASRPEPVASHPEFVDSQCLAIDSQCEEANLHASMTDKKLEALLSMSNKLEAANFRIGWLESQLQEREKEVKLLTDSQHKTGWLTKFASWFFKAQ